MPFAKNSNIRSREEKSVRALNQKLRAGYVPRRKQLIYPAAPTAAGYPPMLPVQVMSVAKPRKQAEAASNFSIERITSDCVRVITNDMADPKTVFAIGLAFTFAYYTHYHWDTTPLGEYCKDKADKNPCKWIHAHITEILGWAMFIPVAWCSTSNRERFSIMLMAGLYIYFVPMAGMFEYVIQSVCLHLFLRAQHPETRIVILVAMVFMYWIGYLVVPSSSSDTKAQLAEAIRKGFKHEHHHHAGGHQDTPPGSPRANLRTTSGPKV